MLNEDFLDLLSALLDADVKFLIVGAYAVGVHARPRATKDMDVWVEASAENSAKVLRALKAFGVPLGDVNEGDFARPGTGFMMGVPPNRIDILTEISGVAFEDAWPRRISAAVGRRSGHLARELAPRERRPAVHRRAALPCARGPKPAHEIRGSSSVPASSSFAASTCSRVAVEDPAGWQCVMEELEPLRVEHGQVSQQILRSVEAPHELTVLLGGRARSEPGAITRTPSYARASSASKASRDEGWSFCERRRGRRRATESLEAEASGLS